MRNIALFAAALSVICACSAHNPYSIDSNDDDSSTLSHGQIVLGDRLDDPYTVENMTKAIFSLYPTKAQRVDITTTDIYVRFLPKTQEEYDRLEDSGVRLLDHPLDYKIVREGDYYHDPSVPEGDITWQYAVVPKDYQFPSDIQYEIIDNCFIADNEDLTKAGLSEIDWDAVERESFRLTGNEDMLCASTKGPYSKTYPQGRICIVDDTVRRDTIGVAGVRVQCNCFVKFANCFTDEDGYYKMDKCFTYDIRYRIMYQNIRGFKLGFNLVLIPASSSTLGKHSPDGVSVVIDRDSDRMLFARSVVNNAGYEYWSKCKSDGYSIEAPPSNLRIWLFHLMAASSAPMLQQGAIIDNTVVRDFLGQYASLVKIFLPDVTIGIRDAFDYEKIYNQTIHELAHASHFTKVGTEYWDQYILYVLTSFVTSGGITYGVGTEENHGYCEVGEMWAYYLESKFNRDRYGSKANYGGSFWFTPQILLNLDERGMDRYKLFVAFTKDVTSIEALQEKLISLYPEYKSVINSAFNRYE